MSYLVLARKYRPKSFQDLVGQEHVVRALTHALESGRIHHAYLFTGTRGVGKTTLSRILAKCLNCEQGVTATPCGVCNACQAIDADHFVDYIELDAASNRGKLIYEISFFFYMKVPDNFTPVCESFTEDRSKEHLVWVPLDTDKKIYPEFFKTELTHPSDTVRHFVTDGRKKQA